MKAQLKLNSHEVPAFLYFFDKETGINKKIIKIEKIGNEEKIKEAERLCLQYGADFTGCTGLEWE